MINKRDATPSIKGFDYQSYYLVNLIIMNINDDSYSLIYEGNEDIDIYINNNLHTIIQIKYHSNLSKNTNETLKGLDKVLKNFINNYNELKDISKIIYSITCDNESELITSPKKYKNYILDNKNIYDLLFNHYENYDKNILLHFCNILQFEFIKDKPITLLIDDILNEIEKNYFNTKLNTTLIIQYKKFYIFSLIIEYINNIIYSNEKNKIIIKEIKNYINIQITKEYSENILLDELILLLNKNKEIITEVFINKIIENIDLINEYKLLKLINIDIENIKKDIHNKTLNLFNKLLNDNTNNLTFKEIKNISHNISNILNSKNNTKNLHIILKEYLNKN
jgi:hypothetical protein